MTVAVTIDAFGRLVCRIEDDGESAVVSGADADAAAAALLRAIDETRRFGYAECRWTDRSREYRLLFCRDGNMLTLVLLADGGTATGGQHLLRVETRFEAFTVQVEQALARVAHPADV